MTTIKKSILALAWMIYLPCFAQSPLVINYPQNNLCIDSVYQLTWTGGLPGDLIDITIIDINAWAVDTIVASGIANTGSYNWTCATGIFPPGTKCFYIQNSTQTNYDFGPNFMTEYCCAQSASSVSDSACFSYTSPSGNYQWNASGMYYDTLINSCGADSVITFSLVITTVDTSVTQNGSLLTSQASGITYQWLDCANGYSAITGETSASFSASQNGIYSVQLSSPGGCVDTSSCHTISGLSENELNQNNLFTVFPNPSNGSIIISVPPSERISSVHFYTLTGQLADRITGNGSALLPAEITVLTGPVMVVIATENGKIYKTCLLLSR